MKKGKTALIAVTAAFLCVLSGIFIGRNTKGNYLELPNRQDQVQTDLSGSTESANLGKVNINTADRRQLMLLPGIGEALADRIIDERSKNGPFSSPEDLTRVEGIGEKKLADMLDFITIGESQ